MSCLQDKGNAGMGHMACYGAKGTRVGNKGFTGRCYQGWPCKTEWKQLAEAGIQISDPQVKVPDFQ